MCVAMKSFTCSIFETPEAIMFDSVRTDHSEPITDFTVIDFVPVFEKGFLNLAIAIVTVLNHV